MTTLLRMTGGKIIPVDTIRTVRPLTDEDKAKAGEKLEIDASRFAVRIEFADKSSKLAELSLDDIRGQGIGLVNIGADKYVVARNITGAEPFTKADAEKIKEKGDYTLSQTFRSRVELAGGSAVLSSATPTQVMERRAKALGLEAPKATAK